MSLDFQLMSVEQCVCYASYLLNVKNTEEEVVHELIGKILQRIADVALDRSTAFEIVKLIRHAILCNQECPNVILTILDSVPYLRHADVYMDEVTSSLTLITNSALIIAIFNRLKGLLLNNSDIIHPSLCVRAILELQLLSVSDSTSGSSGDSLGPQVLDVLEYAVSDSQLNGVDFVNLFKLVLKNMAYLAGNAVDYFRIFAKEVRYFC